MRETKVRMIRGLTHRSRDGLTHATAGDDKVSTYNARFAAVMESVTATSDSIRIGDASEATSMSARASMVVSSPNSKTTPASSAAA